MTLSSSLSRFTLYLTRHGLGATLRRVGVSTKRTLLSNRTVLFYCDLYTQRSSTPDLPSFLKVERYTNLSDISASDLAEIASFWNPKLASRNVTERFALSASL